MVRGAPEPSEKEPGSWHHIPGEFGIRLDTPGGMALRIMMFISS